MRYLQMQVTILTCAADQLLTFREAAQVVQVEAASVAMPGVRTQKLALHHLLRQRLVQQVRERIH